MSTYLPDHIVCKILGKLEVSTLLRCTVVCQLWRRVITSPSFISDHIKFNLSHHEKQILVKICVRDALTNIVSDLYSVHLDNQSFKEIQEVERPLNSDCSYPYFNIVGSFNGLYCLSDDSESYGEKLVLWNPSIRKSLTLPNPRVLHKLYGNYDHVLGFGLLSESNEYKVVRAVYLEQTGGLKAPLEVEIYNLNTGRWSDVDAGECSYVIRDRGSNAFLNNCVHWTAFDRTTGTSQNAIISINLKTEKFDTLMTPNLPSTTWGYVLSTFKDSLCLIHCQAYGDSVWTVWVMNEYGEQSSWVKQFTIASSETSYSIFYSKPFHFREMGDIILVGKSKLVSYDPVSKKEKNLWKYNLGNREVARSLYVDNYMESLVLLNVPNTTSSSQKYEGNDNEFQENEFHEKL